METEITIFDISAEEEPVHNKSQKELFYEELQKNSKLPSYHFQQFFDLEKLDVANEKPTTNIAAILCKYLLKFCVPIVLDTEDDISKVYHVTIHNDVTTKCVTLDKKIIQVPSNVQFRVIGLILPRIFIAAYDKRQFAIRDRYSNTALANSGFYGLADLQTNRWTLTRERLPHASNVNQEQLFHASKLDKPANAAKPAKPVNQANAAKPANTAKPANQANAANQPANLQIIFQDDYSTVTLANYLLDYVKYIDHYYSSNVRLLYDEMYSAVQFDYKKLPMIPVERIDLNALLKELNQVRHGTFGNNIVDNQLALESNKLFYIYQIGKILGIDNQRFKKLLSDKTRDIKYQTDFNTQLNAGFDKKLEIARKQSIAYHKYSVDRLDELDSRQLHVIDLEYKKLKTADESNKTDKAKNINRLFANLQKTFDYNTSDDLKAALSEIKKVVDHVDKTKLLANGACPHVYYSAVERLKHFGKPWLNTELRNMLINDFALPKDTAGYFCKICGEYIADVDNNALMRFNTIGSNTVADDPLQSMIWKEAIYIVTTYVKFATPTPIKPLVNSIAAGLRNVISIEETKLYKSKTNTVDSIKDTLCLFANIYIYAALCAMMVNNPNKIMFGRDKIVKTATGGNSKVGRVGKVGKASQLDKSNVVEFKSEFITDLNQADQPDQANQANPLNQPDQANPLNQADQTNLFKGGLVTQVDLKTLERNVLTTALNLILLTKDAIIKRLKSINVDIVKQIFLKSAYVWARQHAKGIKVEHDNYVTQTLDQWLIATDPTYQYVYLANQLARSKLNTNRVHNPLPELTDFNTVLNLDTSVTHKVDKQTKLQQTIRHNIDLYANVTECSLWNFSNTAFDEYSYESYLSILHYAKEKIYKKDFVPQSAAVAEYYDRFKHILIKEKEIKRAYQQTKVKPLFQITWLNDLLKYNDFSPSKLILARHYCPNGELHAVASTIYLQDKHDTNDTVELTKKDIVEWLTTKNTAQLDKFSTMHAIDERCAKCNTLIRHASETGASFENMFKLLDDRIAFYQYYSTRCPLGELHDIVDNICKKCKLHTDVKPSNTADPYYDKYLEKFKKIERESNLLAITSLEQIVNELKIKPPNTPTIEYKYTLQNTAEVSQMSKVTYNILINIGLMDGIKFEDISSSKINPSKTATEEAFCTQAMRVKNYTLYVIRNYNTFLNHEHVMNMTVELRDILHAQKKIEITGMEQGLPQITTDGFLARDTHYKFSLTTVNYANYLMEYLFGMILSLYKKSNERFKATSIALAEYFIKYIVEEEKLYCKAPSVFSKIETVAADENFSDDDSAVSGDNGYISDRSADEFEDEEAAEKNETYENDIDDDAYDVENAGDIWETE